MRISLIIPSRNNLKYLKWSYDSIRENQEDHLVEICVADDASTDGTWEWCQELMQADTHFKAIRNEGPERLGHTILYDRLINEVAGYDVCMIYHADMFLCPKALDAIEQNIGPKKIVSLTRIEPPLHPPGPEKILMDFGTEPEQFNKADFYEWFFREIPKNYTNKTTEGIFAPWAFMKADFQEIGGHDALYAPQSKEDSDIFNRFQLNGVKFVQVWDGCVYHMTCRGSRFNPTLTTPGTNSQEWELQNVRSTRNFIRKWGHFVQHDEYMKPIIPPKFSVAFNIDNCTPPVLYALEPWCTTVYVDENSGLIDSYIASEQKNTKIDLKPRVRSKTTIVEHDVMVTIDANRFTNDDFYYIQNLSAMLAEVTEFGEFEIGNIQIKINNLTQLQNTLITCKKLA